MTYMNFVSVLGLLSLMLIAWLLSFHRTKIKMRPILWGMGLQLLFALIILSKDHRFSYLGMAIFGIFLVVYVLKGQPHFEEKPMVKHVVHGLGALVLGVVLFYLHGVISLGWFLVAVVAVLILNGFWLKKESVQFWGSATLITPIVAFFIATEQTGAMIFQSFSESVKSFLGLSDFGADFLFGNLSKEEYFFTGDNSAFPGFGMVFAFKVLPTIIFFGGFMSVLYYLGVMQKVIVAMSRFMRWTLGTSGSESLSCSANIFVGQTEAPLLIKPFLKDMTSSELLTIMVGGFATIAGGVLAAYINMGVDPGHLIAASVMSAPAALVMAKIIYPEQEQSATAGDVEMPKIESGDNILEAAASGITDGFKLALNVGAMLIGFIALIAVLDVLLNWIDLWIDGRMLGGEMREYAIQSSMSPVGSEYDGIFPGSLQTLFGTALRPLAWLMGVPWEDAGGVGTLLGIKLSLNEFVAFGELGNYINGNMIGPRAQIIATYALCGFANFSSIGIQLGGISSLAPERRRDLARVVFKAMIGGAFASWMTACVAGIMWTG